MEKRLLFSILVLSCILTAPPAAALGGYTVTPAYDIPDQEYHDFDEISFSDLPPRMMIIELALFLSPALILPAEILSSLFLVSCLGFHRVTRQTILDHKERRELYELIRGNPGISLSTLREKTGLNDGTARYHLGLLNLHGMIVCRSYHGSRYYYARNKDYGRMEAALLTYLHTENARVILDLLSRDDDLSHHDLMAATGTASPTISWQMKRLIADGVVASYREEKKTKYLLTPAAVEALGTARREADQRTTPESGPVPG
ncbi:winged helix-turn-helix transcriptional regulator [Methanofollis ethanolicus]|uniref:winged helix-turn-helix transcriptional regulator n=1 Tax=Methanofollis ethanolicus TaxID=488124 RepID=UPI000831F66F|nr:winged helix-turn-helix transcriptional regulator [Methanofollis ethanolicus]